MLFEKPNFQKPISLDVIGVLFLIVIFTAFLTYGACVISGIPRSSDANNAISLFDLFSLLAQITTACAFGLACLQYRKSLIQQRQLSIAAEAKAQLEKMIIVIGNIQVGENTSLSNLNKSITLLSNLAMNFDELFKAMHEDIQRAIVRMQWQDMYFNHLCHSLKEIDATAILKNVTSIDSITLSEAISAAKNAADDPKLISSFKDYIFIDCLLNNPKIKAEFSLKGKIESLDSFVFYFLNAKNLNDLLYGLLSRVDIRAHAPLLAVAEPNKWALEAPVQMKE